MGKKSKIVIGGIVILVAIGAIILTQHNEYGIKGVEYICACGEHINLEHTKIDKFYALVQNLEEDKPEENLRMGYYEYKILYDDKSSKDIIVNATNVKMDSKTYKSSQEICNQFRSLFNKCQCEKS